MRWLQSMSSSLSSSSAASPSSSTRTNDNRSIEPKLTRQKNLRYLSEQEIDDAVNLPDPPADSSSPQPLPLPQLALFFKKKHTSFSTSTSEVSDCPLPSPKDAPRSSDHNKDMQNAAPAPAPGRKSGEIIGNSTSRRVWKGGGNCSSSSLQNKFKINVPTRSVPSSPYGSFLFSPPGKTTGGGGDFYPYYYITPKASEMWSAPEMPTSTTTSSSDTQSYNNFENNYYSPIQSPPQVKSPAAHTRRRRSTSPITKDDDVVIVGGPPPPITNSPTPILSLSPSPSPSPSPNPNPSQVHRLPLPPEAGINMPFSSSTSPSINLFNKKSPIQLNNWKKGKLLGRGTFGSVYVATNRETGALCAMKEVELCHDDPKSIECMRQIQQEIKVLSQLKHPNIVQYYGSEIVDDRFYIYLEYVHPGSINKYVREHCGAMTESVVRNFTRHILSGLAYLHSKKTIHRDIKGANLLVDASGVVKLADFGMAKHLSGQATDLSLKGSPYWMAPELMQVVIQKDNNSDLALAIDIWSLGCTIIEMLTGKPPWSEYEGVAAMFKVMKDTPPIPETLSPEGKDFLQCCFKRNPAERPSASMLLEHSFLKASPYLDGSHASREESCGIKSKVINYVPLL